MHTPIHTHTYVYIDLYIAHLALGGCEDDGERLLSISVGINIFTHTYTHTYLSIYIYIYT